METINAILIAFGAVFLAVFALYLLVERDPREASRKTSKRAVGVGVGAGGTAMAAAVVGLQALAQLPEIALTMVGLWAIVTGVSPEVFLAVAVVTYVAAEAISGVRAGNW